MEPWAIVTGGTGGLGAAVVSRLQERGVGVVALDIAQGPLSSDRVVYRQVDLSDYSAAKAVSIDLLERLGPPRYIVAAAGLYERRTLFEYDAETTERSLRANLLSLVYLLRFFLPAMLSATGCRVVALSSQVGVTGGSDPLYSATKAGVTAFMKSMARQYGSDDISFTTVSCGPVDGTAMAGGMSAARRDYYSVAALLA